MKRYDINDYQIYKKSQLSRSSHKWGGKTFRANLQDFIALMKKVYEITGKIDSICCMGIRNGNEYWAFQGGKEKWFLGLNEYKDSIVYGIDLDGQVTGVGPRCYAYDFSYLPEDWENKFGMVYSNSLDHAFDVKQTLDEWHRITKPNGFIMLQLSPAKENACDIHSFEPSDVDDLFDKEKFEVLKSWGLNVLLKVKK